MQINSDITRNRAEEYGFDLWKEFVIPPYFPKLELMKSEKPQIIEGGRGSGKTMLLRYLCHDTQFSTQRENIPIEDYHRIGIYWKMDIMFASMMNSRGAESQLWTDAFIDMAVLVLSMEVIRSIKNIAMVNEKAADEIRNIDFSDLKMFDQNVPDKIEDFKSYLHKQYIKFQLWVSNYKRLEQPLFYPKLFLDELIGIVKNQVSILQDSFYSVYLDEYENLNVVQKKIINTWVKQSQSPLVFNIAMKHQAFDVADTLSDEKIVEVHDYRKIDLEEYLKEHFATFASEIFLLKVHRHLYRILPNEDFLYDTSIDIMSYRTGSEYTISIKKLIETIFPKLTEKEVAARIFEDSRLKNRLLGMVEKDYNELKASEFFDKTMELNPGADVLLVLHALLNRNGVDYKNIFCELGKFIGGEQSKFTEWIHNNLFGCILNFYGSLNRNCPLYAGYETFITMSKDNIRHFLELCYTSISQSEDYGELHKVSIEDQIIAVKSVSGSMLSEIKRFGPKGNLLYLFSLRLGNLFEELRKRESQSEPEQNHFSIKGTLDAESQHIIRELVKWSVLYEDKLTKQKSIEAGLEYIFNPIYSSYFTISYRKKRRIELTPEEITALYSESDETYKSIIKRIKTKISSKPNQQTPSLFEGTLFDV